MSVIHCYHSVVRMWRELARPQVHGYEMNAIVSLDVVRYVSAGDEKLGRVFSATSGFVKSLLSDATIVAHPSLQTLPTSRKCHLLFACFTLLPILGVCFGTL